jgi:hypothetical protein
MRKLTALCHPDQIIQGNKMDFDILACVEVLLTYFFNIQSQETIQGIGLKAGFG